MPQVKFKLNVGSKEFEKYYNGQAKSVLVTAMNGLKVQFPANLLTDHVSYNGVQGTFVLHYNEKGKAKSLVRV